MRVDAASGRRRDSLASVFSSLIFLCISCLPAPSLFPQSMDDRIVSEHIRIRIPAERAWLGREAILELERCWRYMNGATGGALPRKMLVKVDWNDTRTSSDAAEDSISIGMNHQGAAADMRSFLLRNAAREMARLGLLKLSREARPRSDHAFLYEGMAEIFAHEYQHTSRRLQGAWAIAHMLDAMKLLALSAPHSGPAFPHVPPDLRPAAAITFMMACRELYGRNNVLKLFQSLRRGSLEQGFAAAFRTGAAGLELAWLKMVREYVIPEDLTATSEDDSPSLRQAMFVPSAGKAGEAAQLRLVVANASHETHRGGIFVKDLWSGRVLHARMASENGGRYHLAEFTIEAERPAGQYEFQVTAVDESGNIRNWKRTYEIQ